MNSSAATTRPPPYGPIIHAVEEFATYFHRSPEQLGPEHIRDYQVHLFRDRKLSPRTIEGQAAALRFLFIKTLGRPYLPDAIPFPKHHRHLPTVLSREEVSRLIDSASNLMHRAMLPTLRAAHARRRTLHQPATPGYAHGNTTQASSRQFLSQHARRRLQPALPKPRSRTQRRSTPNSA